MLELISSGQSTKLHIFPALDTQFTYPHHEDESQRFSVFPGKKLFLTVNRTTGIELLRTTEKNGSDIIQRLKKRQMNDVECSACSSFTKGEIALGMGTGVIRFFSIKTAEVSSVKFRPDHTARQVTYLGYSSGDDMLASIYDNGDINLYGLSTGVKMYTEKIDKHSTMLRFNPTKRFNMAVASYTGAVTVFDTQSKRVIVQHKTAHSEPCPDLCWSHSSADTLLSVGYDCKMKFYDLRSKVGSNIITNPHPLSAVTLSNCGVYCCVGNLKGELVSYDLRNPKIPLHCAQSHGGIVTGVSFIPSGGAIKSGTTADVSDSAAYLSGASSIRHSVGSTIPDLAASSNNSFLNFLDKCSTHPRDSAFRRDSIQEMEIKTNHQYDDFDDSRTSFGRRLSTGRDALKNRRRTTLCDSVIAEDVASDAADDVFAISEELSHPLGKIIKLVEPHSVPDMELDKENKNIDSTARHPLDPFENIGQHDKINSSTPNNQVKAKCTGIQEENQDSMQEAAPQMDNRECQDGCERKLDAIQCRMEIMEKSLLAHEEAMMCRLERMEKNILDKLQQHSTSIHFCLWIMEDTRLQVLQDGVSLLARNDDFVQQYFDTQEENQELRKQVQQLQRGKRN